MRRGHSGLAVVATGALGLGLFAGVGMGGRQGAHAVPSQLRMGVLVPLTGALKDFGAPNRRAAFLGRDEINRAAKKAGIAFTVRTFAANTETDPKAAQEAATKVIDGNGASCVVGPMASSEVIAVAQNVSLDAEVPIISPSSTAADVRTKVKDEGFVFRTPVPDTLQGPVLAERVIAAFGKGATVNVAAQNDAYGVGLAKTFTAAFKKLGGKVGKTVIFNPGASTLDSEAGQIVQGNPDGFVIVTFPTTYDKLGPALVRTGKWDPKKTWGTDGIRSVDLPKTSGLPATEGVRGTSATDRGNPNAAPFDRLWKVRKLGKRQTYDAQMFDAAVLCALATVRAGSTDGAKIAKQVRVVSGPPGTKYTFLQLPQALKAVAAGKDIDYQGASGAIDLFRDGDPGAGNYVVWRYTGGKLVDGTIIYRARKGA
ncbi:MAG: ABC transporter substrate-binding protein [Actinomycetota bacterium]